MAWTVEVRDSCQVLVASLWLGRHDRFYVLPNGRRCPMEQRVGWCRQCQTFVAAEEVPSIAEIDERHRQLQEGDYVSQTFGKSIDPAVVASFIHQRVADLQLEREWRLIRQSPPRCLQCSGTDVALLPIEVQHTVHPLTGSRLTAYSNTCMVMVNQYTYTVEGYPKPETRAIEEEFRRAEGGYDDRKFVKRSHTFPE